MLASLVDKSLLRVSPAGRYDRHPLIYQYTFEQLAEDRQELETSFDKHARYFLTLTERAAPHLNSADQAMWLDRFEEEHDNLRGVLAWLLDRNDSERALRMVVATSDFWSIRGFFDEGGAFFQRALALPGERSPLRARALSWAGTLASQRQAHDEAREYFEEGLAIGRELGDDRGVSAALDHLGTIATGRGEYQLARELLEESLSLRRGLGLAGATAWALVHLSGVEIREGNLVKAQAYLEEGVTLFRSVNHDQGMAWALQTLGQVARDGGDYPAARRHLEEALVVRRQLKEWHAVAGSLIELGSLELEAGEPEKARVWLREGLAVSRRYALEDAVASALDLLSQGTLEEG